MTFFCQYHASCVFIILILHNPELQFQYCRILPYLIYLYADNGTDIIPDIKFSNPIIRNIVSGNAFTYSSARIITAKVIHNLHPFDVVISYNYG